MTMLSSWCDGQNIVVVEMTSGFASTWVEQVYPRNTLFGYADDDLCCNRAERASKKSRRGFNTLSCRHKKGRSVPKDVMLTYRS
jgi:hypothetical protein